MWKSCCILLLILLLHTQLVNEINLCGGESSKWNDINILYEWITAQQLQYVSKEVTWLQLHTQDGTLMKCLGSRHNKNMSNIYQTIACREYNPSFVSTFFVLSTLLEVLIPLVGCCVVWILLALNRIQQYNIIPSQNLLEHV